jgi:hypothetical protein
MEGLVARAAASRETVRLCGSTVYWEGEGFPGYVAVAIGNFGDPNFPAPSIAIWEESRHPWVSLRPDTPPKRVAKQG